MKPLPFLLSILCGLLFSTFLPAEDLNMDQLENISMTVGDLKEDIKKHQSERNNSAGARFAAAAGDPKAAITLYLNCHKIVHYDREGRPDSDFRAWKDSQEGRIKDDAFVESLLLQLRYLALSCDAAEAENPSEVFSELLSFVDSLSYMEEMPTGALTGSVASSIFAQAFYLEDLLGSNAAWEPTPFNIGGIYDKTILPYLRAENPTALVNAWDKRIEQQSRIVMMIEDHKLDQLRGKNREEERRVRNNQERQGGLFRSLDKDDYLARTLPKLKWGKMKDVFQHISEVQGAQEMIAFVKEHTKHELGPTFLNELADLIDEAKADNNQEPEDPQENN